MSSPALTRVKKSKVLSNNVWTIFFLNWYIFIMLLRKFTQRLTTVPTSFSRGSNGWKFSVEGEELAVPWEILSEKMNQGCIREILKRKFELLTSNLHLALKRRAWGKAWEKFGPISLFFRSFKGLVFYGVGGPNYFTFFFEGFPYQK